MSIITTLSNIAYEFLSAFFSDFRFIVIYVIVIFLVKKEYQRYIDYRTNIMGQSEKTIRHMIEETILFGLVSGFAASIIIVFGGETFETETFNYIIAVSILLFLVDMRYICFSYSGGIVAFAGVVFGISSINVCGLLLLVAVIHIIESLLIFFMGSKNFTPVFIQHENGIAGAFLTKKFWPVPVVFLTFVTSESIGGAGNPIGGTIPQTLLTGALLLGLECAVTFSAYTDIAITKQPEKKSRETAIQIFLYSIVLLVLALIAVNSAVWGIIGALFAVLGHEAIVLVGRYREKRGIPIYSPVKRGLRVLDMVPGGHAERMGLKRGDIILGINGRDIQTEYGMTEILKSYPVFVIVDAIDPDGNVKTCQYKCFPGGLDRMGIVCVPREQEVTYNVEYFQGVTVLKNLVARFRGFGRPV